MNIHFEMKNTAENCAFISRILTTEIFHTANILLSQFLKEGTQTPEEILKFAWPNDTVQMSEIDGLKAVSRKVIGGELSLMCSRAAGFDPSDVKANNTGVTTHWRVVEIKYEGCSARISSIEGRGENKIYVTIGGRRAKIIDTFCSNGLDRYWVAKNSIDGIIKIQTKSPIQRDSIYWDEPPLWWRFRELVEGLPPEEVASSLAMLTSWLLRAPAQREIQYPQRNQRPTDAEGFFEVPQ